MTVQLLHTITTTILALLQSTLLPLDPGYSDWLGSILKMINLAQLQILKLNLQVGGPA